MDHPDRRDLQVKLMTMTDSELLDREVSLAGRRPCPTTEAIEYGLLMSELRRRTEAELDKAGSPERSGEVESALAAAIAFFLRNAGKDVIVLSENELSGGWLEVTRTPEFWSFRLKNKES